MLSGTTLQAQSKTATDTFTVYGNCGQCKTRIEEAAYIKGVKSAVWDKKTKVLTVVYLTDKVSLSRISLAIADAGHDTKEQKASDKSYAKLPSCCAYRNGTCDHD
ncbi:MAG: heavy-metal-associated domain-containing protein [Chitinophagaceae bacterium]|nr:heavy-metal-associated domain-containing protein [Chitinophagaceae bacterium]